MEDKRPPYQSITLDPKSTAVQGRIYVQRIEKSYFFIVYRRLKNNKGRINKVTKYIFISNDKFKRRQQLQELLYIRWQLDSSHYYQKVDGNGKAYDLFKSEGSRDGSKMELIPCKIAKHIWPDMTEQMQRIAYIDVERTYLDLCTATIMVLTYFNCCRRVLSSIISSSQSTGDPSASKPCMAIHKKHNAYRRIQVVSLRASSLKCNNETSYQDYQGLYYEIERLWRIQRQLMPKIIYFDKQEFKILYLYIYII